MEIRIGKSAKSCQVCQRPFVHNEEFTSVVRIQDQALTREDYCLDCWDAAFGGGAFSQWSPRYYDARVADQEPPETFSPLRALFYEAIESDDRAEVAKAYLGAQLLRRQKVFRLIKESDAPEGEDRVALFSDRIGNRLVEVRDPNLTTEDLEQGRQRLMTRLAELEATAESQDTQQNAYDTPAQEE